MTDVVAMLERMAAGPKPFVCVVSYESGKVRRIPQPTRIQAENVAERERRKIGRPLIDRMTGTTVRVIAVTVTEVRS